MNDKIIITEPILIRIGQIADKLNYEVYVVGGYVRDHFLNRPRNDFDITVVGDSLEFSKIIASEFNSKSVIYERFRTAMVPIGDYKVEFVGTRKEEYIENSRNPIVTEGELEDDLKRRDFTINAMAASLNKTSFGNITDLFNGLEDIDKKLLRTPLDPVVTYNDDPLRMMRAARFAAQLGFFLDSASKEAIKRLHERITIISQERVTDELLKILASPKPSIGFYLLQDTGLLQIIFPEISKLEGTEIIEQGGKKYNHKDVFKHTLKVVDNISEKTNNIFLRFAALCHDIAKPVTKRFNEISGWSFHGHEEIGARWMKGIFSRLKLPLEHLPYVAKMIRLHQRPMALVDEEVTDSAVRRLAAKAGDILDDLFILCRADITTQNPEKSEEYFGNYERVFQKVLDVQEKDKLKEFQSPVRGEEIMEICNIKPSKLVGFIKTAIEEAILDGEIPNEYESAKEYFLQNKDKWINEFETQPTS